jgi:type I restriction enzyme, S subunit
MSNINRLIKEHCPNGVDFRTLGEIGQFVRGNGMPKTDFTESGVGAIHYGQIYTFYGIWAEETKSFVAPQTAAKLAKVEPGDIIITNTSENLDDVGKAVAWLGAQQIVTGGHATVFKHQQEPKYLAYWLQSPSFRLQKKKLATGTKVIDVSAKSLAKIVIPIPPIEVQREIVKILDTFSKLEAELEAELEARQIQYTFYCDQLLTHFDPEAVRFEPLATVGKWYGGGTPSKSNGEFWRGGSIPWVSPKDMGRPVITSTEDYITEAAVKGSSTKLVPPTSVVMVVRSSILDRIFPSALVPIPVALNQDMKAVVPCADILPAYLAHILRSRGQAILRFARRTGGSVASIETSKLLAFQIPIPSLSEQQRIVSILNRLDALVNDLSIGLPAELRARRQQYEHYRDRLLTFEEAG